jgi:hypothetical protein
MHRHHRHRYRVDRQVQSERHRREACLVGDRYYCISRSVGLEIGFLDLKPYGRHDEVGVKDDARTRLRAISCHDVNNRAVGSDVVWSITLPIISYTKTGYRWLRFSGRRWHGVGCWLTDCESGGGTLRNLRVFDRVPFVLGAQFSEGAFLDF